MNNMWAYLRFKVAYSCHCICVHKKGLIPLCNEWYYFDFYELYFKSPF